MNKTKEVGKEGKNEGWQAVGFVAGVRVNEESVTSLLVTKKKHLAF